MSEVIGTLSSAELASIRDVSDRFARHLVARDFDSIAQLYTADAVLMVDPEPLSVVFDSALEPSSGTFQVRGGADE